MSTTPSERTQQRRRLLKAAASAPGIFVLPTGVALANSSLNACIQRGIEHPPSPYPTTPEEINSTSTDGWVRRQSTNSEGTTVYIAEPNDPITDGRFVAGASCWNSVHPGGPAADPNTNLIQ